MEKIIQEYVQLGNLHMQTGEWKSLERRTKAVQFNLNWQVVRRSVKNFIKIPNKQH